MSMCDYGASDSATMFVFIHSLLQVIDWTLPSCVVSKAKWVRSSLQLLTMCTLNRHISKLDGIDTNSSRNVAICNSRTFPNLYKGVSTCESKRIYSSEVWNKYDGVLVLYKYLH